MRYRNFDVAVEEMRRDRPTFELAGRLWTCRPALSTKALASLEQGTDDPMQIMRDFFSMCLIKADRQPFIDLIDEDPDDDDAVPITPGQLKDILEWLVEGYTGNPMRSPEQSLPGPQTIGAPLRVVSLEQGTGT